MNVPKMMSVLALVVLVVGTIATVAIPPSMKEGKSSSITQEEKVLEVVNKCCTDYDALGAGSIGFTVKDGNELKFVSCDSGSMLDRMPMPKYLKAVKFGDGKVCYIPLNVL